MIDVCFRLILLFVFVEKICTLGLLHIMRYLLLEAMKEEKRKGLLTEHEINNKYRNSFSYQGSRYLFGSFLY